LELVAELACGPASGLAIDPKHALDIDDESVPPKQDRQSAKAEPSTLARELNEAITDRLVLLCSAT